MTDLTSGIPRVFMIVAMCCWAFQAAAEPNPFLETKGPGVKRSLTPAELRAPKPFGKYTIQLPDGRQLHFQNVSVETNAGVRTIRASSGTTRLLLTSDNRRAYGYVLTDDSYYRIDTSEGQTIIADAKALPDPSQILGRVVDDAVINYQNFSLNEKLAESPSAANEGPFIVDIAFFYDGALAISEGLQAPRTYAQSAVDYTNAAFATHSLDIQLRLVYVGELSVPLTGDPWTTFVGNAERLDVLAAYGVDLGHYIYNYNWTHGYCGKGYVPGRSAVSAVECGDSTIAHEIGHNFGMNHDRPNANYINLPYNGYNYGDWCGGSATLMTYGFGAPELPFYSSPLQSFGGEACGVAIGEPNAAYNAEVVNATKAQTAAYTPAQTIYGDVSITTVGPVQLTEGVDAQSFIEVTRNGDLTVETSVEVGIVGVEAIPGADYVDAVERITFLPGESVKQFVLNIIDDENYEPSAETLEVVIRYPNGLAVTGPSLTVEIISDDPDRGIASFPTYYRYVDENIGEIVIDVNRVGSAGLPLTVAFETVEEVAKPGIDYVATSGNVVFAANQTSATISIPIIDDDLFEGLESKRFFVHLVGDNIDPQNRWFWVYVRNDDIYHGQLRLSSDAYFVMENDSSLDVTIERINGLEDSHFFWLHSSNGTAISYQDFVASSTRTTVSAGTSFRTITLSSIFNNDIADGEKYFNLDLDPEWGSADPIHARVYIIDDEAPTDSGGVLDVAAPTITATEDGGFAEIAIQRQSGAAGAAIVSYSTSPGTASAAVDYNDRSGTVGWVDGDVSDKIVQIPIINDGIVETDETFNFTISNAGGAVLGSSLTTVVSIADNDGPGTLSFDLSQYTLSETGWVDVAVVRELGSVGRVGVSYQTVGDTAQSDIDYSAAQATLSWSDGDTDPKFVRLYSIDDADIEFSERFRVELSDPTGGADLGELASTTVTIPTSDAPGFEPTFDDVSQAHWAWLYIHTLANSGITAGCGNGNYCPDGLVTRAQMAVFLERGMNGSGFSPPAATGNVFLDVGANDFAASYIEQLASDGITAGCGNGNYCPDAVVTRDQMAVFLLRAKYGSSYSPPAATGIFGDVDLSHWAVRWIEQLATEGITAGCGNNNYCPDTEVTRDQMAVFLVRTFRL